MFDLIVIGSGPGGYEAAAHAADLGKKVCLIEKHEIGGTCLNTGCIPAKTLLQTARIFSEMRESAGYGVKASTASIDWPALMARKARIIDGLRKAVTGMLQKKKVEIVTGCAKFVSANSVSVNGNILESSNILIATGAKPSTPPIPGLDLPVVFNSSSIFSLEKQPDSIVVLGGGVIGLEMACFFQEIGTPVTVIEMLPNIGAGLDGELSRRLLMNLKKIGIQFHVSSRVTKVENTGISFTDPAGQNQFLQTSHVLLAAGRSPVLDDLGLEKTGIQFSPKGISADESGRTNVPGIWACGDVTGRFQLAHAATRQGIAAVNTMFGTPDTRNPDTVPSVIYTHPEIASVGKTEEQLKEEGIPYKKVSVPLGISARYIIENEGKSGLIKVMIRPDGLLLGIHILGGPAGEMISLAAYMMEKGAKAEDIRQVVLPHPTVAEALKEALLQAIKA